MPLQTLTPDPLEGYSGLSLFARTFASLPIPPLPHGSDDLEQYHHFLKSKPLRSPNKLMEQGKTIVDDGSELVNLDISSFATKVTENPRERRPALGRKRARFSLKPESRLSQPTVSLVPSLDIDKLNDPEEFFMAFERAENAKREIQRQTGDVLMDLDQNIQSGADRLRRPGILGRSVKYKHGYSTTMFHVENFTEKTLSPLHGLQQENSDPNVKNFADKIMSPLCGSQLEISDQDVELQEELAASVTNAENNVNELLDKLLTGNYDGDDTLSILKESLQIKPIDLEKICLPDLQDNRRIDLKSSRKSLSNPRDSLVSIQNIMKGNSRTTPNQKAESSVHCLASPNLSKSPLASISLLKKRMLQPDVPSDPFSTDDFGLSSVRNVSSVESIGKHSDQAATEKEVSMSDNNDRRTSQRQVESLAHHLASPTPPRNPLASMSLLSDLLSRPISTDNIEQSPEINVYPTESFNKKSGHFDTEKEHAPCILSSPLLEAKQTAIGNVSSELEGRDFAGLFDKFVNDNARRFDSDINAISSGSHADLESNNLSRPEVGADGHTIKPNGFDERVEDLFMEAVVSADTQLNVGDPDVDNMNTIQREPDEPDPAMDEDHIMDGSSRNAESGQELHEQQNKKGKMKAPVCKERNKKAVSQRQSLAASGTTFDAVGRRRSTRIRSRPLEFWKGERFLYGRIHSSLATVIGIKYESPAKADGENPILKVKSYVSEEYKDLVNLAARF